MSSREVENILGPHGAPLYRTDVRLGSPPSAPACADLLDQFEHEVFDVRKPKLLCLPVDRNGEGILNPADRLVGYPIKLPGRGSGTSGFPAST